MKSVGIAILTVVFGISVGAGTRLYDATQAAKSNVKTLMHTQLADEFTPGREVLVDMVEIPPNASLERHWHPGEEFHYYLDGEVEIQLDGASTIKGAPGMVGHVPYKKWHRAVAGAKGAKILVFRVHAKGEPWRYVDEGTANEAK